LQDPGPKIAWIFIKVIRHGRLRCRSNKALNNYLAKVFPSLHFEEVPKIDRMGKQYMGLKISNRDTKQIVEDSDFNKIST